MEREDRTGRVSAVIGSTEGTRPQNVAKGMDGLTAPTRLMHQYQTEGAIPWGWNDAAPEACTATTKAGTACEARPVTGEQFCYFHSQKKD